MAEATPVAPVAAAPVPPPAPSATPPPAAPAPQARQPNPVAERVRAERAIQAEKAAWKAQRAKEEAEWAPRLTKVQEVEAKLAAAKKDPLAALDILGVSYDELTNAKLNGGKPPADLAVREALEEVAKLRSELKEKETRAEKEARERQEAEEKQTVSGWHAATTRWVSAQPEFELINALGYGPEVGKMIEEHFDATGEEVPREHAAKLLEEHLQGGKIPLVADAFRRLTSTKWFKSQFQPVGAKPAAEEAPPRRRNESTLEVTEIADQIRRTAAPTITNGMSAGAPAKNAAAKTRAELRALAYAEAEKLERAK